MKRSPIRRRRRTKHQLANIEHAEYRAWIAAQPCAHCKRTFVDGVQVAHVGRGGMGLKHGTDLEVAPLCSPGCHEDFDQTKGLFARPLHYGKYAWRAVMRDIANQWIAVHRGRFEARFASRMEVPF